MKQLFITFIALISLSIKGQSLQVAQDYLDRSDYKRAVPLYEKIIEESKLSKDLNLQVTAQNGLADCYLDLGASYKSMAILKENIVLLNNQPTKNYLLLAKTHQLLATCYDKLYLIEDYLKECKSFYYYYNKAAPDKEIYKALYFAYVGRYYNMRFMVDKAFTYTNTALKIYHKNKNEEEVEPYIFYNAHLFTERNHAPTLAIKFKYVDSLIHYVNKRYPYDNLKKARLMVSIAAPNIEVATNLYYNVGDYSLNIECANRAISFYNEAIKMNDKLAGFYHSNGAFLNSLKGLMLFYKKDYQGALENYEIGIQRLTSSPYVFTNSPTLMFDLLKWKAWCLGDMYKEKKDVQILFEIEETLLLEEKYWDQFANTVLKNKKSFNTNSYQVPPYNFMAKNYYEMYLVTGKLMYINLYFEYDEKSRYSNLLEILYNEKNSKLPDGSEDILIKTYKTFEDLFLKVNGKIYLQGDPEVKFDNHYKAYISELNQSDLFTNEKLVSLKEVQNNLKEEEAILSYNVYDYQAHFIPFILMITKDKVKIIQLNNKEAINSNRLKVASLIESLQKNDISLFKSEAYKLYETYFQPIETHLPHTIKQIKIIPSADFGNFPFDILLTSNSNSNDFSKLPYLAKKYQFSYGLSLSISTIVDQLSSNTNTLSIFSPNFSIKNLSELKESNKQSKIFANLYSIPLIQDKNATKGLFSNHLKNDKAVILLSHGRATVDEVETNKGFYLSDGFLSVNEVYNMKSNCDFLLLGTCESGVGFKSSEGTINLARAFTAIGVKSMMLASWKIDEKSSTQIISSFLKYLDGGCTKSEALQKAKLDYLATASPRMANPLYWAGLNITGNNETIQLRERNYWWWGLISIPIICGALYFRKRIIKPIA